jgi:signal transduction histidine kinase
VPKETTDEPTDAGRALECSAHRKMLVMERSVSQLRAIVIGLNVAAYFAFIGPHAPRAPLALGIVCVAVPYATWSLLARPYQRFPLLRFGALTLSMDATLITLWVIATGGPQSEFWVVYLVSVVSVAMRYDFRATIFASLAEAMLYSVAMFVDGRLGGVGAVTRPGYILIAGLAAGFLSRQERLAREELVKVERLEQEHNNQLARARDKVKHLRDVDRMKTEFVAYASHELRTPLTTLSGLAKMLFARRGEMSEEMIDECLTLMQRQGDRVGLLITNLLDLSQIENGRLSVRMTEVSVNEVAEAALAAAPPPAAKTVDIRVAAHARAFADPDRLEQILVNLFTNAYNYGGEKIVCDARVMDGHLVMRVTDDGAGVPDESVPRLFEPFRRGGNSGSVSGSGLGLVISKRIAEAFGGELWYEPATPRGASFGLSLPRAPGPEMPRGRAERDLSKLS